MKKRILVVDDDHFMRETLNLILTQAGYDVLTAEDGRHALSRAKYDKPDLVIIDGVMPGLHGFLACKAIKDLHAPPKVILHTAVYTKLTYKLQAKADYGADAVLCKPVKTSELLACIEKHLAKPDDQPVAAPPPAPQVDYF